MDVQQLTKQILREAKLRAVKNGLEELEKKHVKLAMASRNRRKGDEARLQEECYELIQDIKSRFLCSK